MIKIKLKDNSVLEVEEKPGRFHAALNAVSRTYTYRVAIGEVPSVFDRKYTYYCFGRPNAGLMKEAASQLIGRHDFKNFSTVKKNKSTVKEMISLDIYSDAKEIQITMCANDFLHNMARMIASTLLEIGLERRPVSDIAKILDPGSNMLGNAPTEASGMFLEEVSYE